MYKCMLVKIKHNTCLRFWSGFFSVFLFPVASSISPLTLLTYWSIVFAALAM